MDKIQAMSRALQLAMRGTGYVAPNPRVGCVILKNDLVIGEGWHKHYGDLHAEQMAIESCVEPVEGSTVVVNLEPCSHFGKQPPCAQSLIDKKVAKVIIGISDPNPLVQGNGIAMLKSAGIEVELGVLENECSWINRFFLKNVKNTSPYVIAKIGQSLDGCISTIRGESKWITSEHSRTIVHQMRAEVDAVLIGRVTALKDDPELTVRFAVGRNPKRVILDTNLSLPLSLKAFSDSHRKETIVCCSKKVANSRKAENLKIAGVQVLGVSETSENSLLLHEVLVELYKSHQVTSIMVEGGALVLSSFLQFDLVDELHMFTAPLVIGNGKHSFNTLYTPTLADARKFVYKGVSSCGDDIHIITTRSL